MYVNFISEVVSSRLFCLTQKRKADIALFIFMGTWKSWLRGSIKQIVARGETCLIRSLFTLFHFSVASTEHEAHIPEEKPLCSRGKIVVPHSFSISAVLKS